MRAWGSGVLRSLPFFARMHLRPSVHSTAHGSVLVLDSCGLCLMSYAKANRPEHAVDALLAVDSRRVARRISKRAKAW